jgi:AcrR family transcriptional regulator
MADKPYHHGDLRNLLIKTGIELINQEGIKNFSLRKVAARCGVSHAAPYGHFKNKEELLKAMQEYVTEQLMAALNHSMLLCPDRNDQKVLLEMGKCYVMFFIKEPAYYPFIFSQSWMEINLSLDCDSAKNYPPFELLKTSAVRILEKDGIPKEKIEDIIISLWATVHGLASIATMKNVHYNKDWETKIKDIICSC